MPGWTGSNKNYDEHIGQETVCRVHFLGRNVLFGVSANYADRLVAEQACIDISGSNDAVISWYP